MYGYNVPMPCCKSRRKKAEHNKNMEGMNMLDKEKLMNYIKNEFPGVIDTHWNWDLLENIIDYGIKNRNYVDGEILTFLNEIIPEITEKEIMQCLM